MKLSGHTSWLPDIDQVATVYAKRGLAAARWKLAQVRDRESSTPEFRAKERAGEESYVPVAEAYALAGDPNHALPWLDQAVRANDAQIWYELALAPELDSLRPDPRFQEFLNRSGRDRK